MSQIEETRAVRLPRDLLAERCRELGLPLWGRYSDGHLGCEPSGWNDLDVWLTAPRLREVVAASMKAWKDDAPPSFDEIAPGCWLIPVTETRFELKTCNGAVLALSTSFPDTDLFREICESADLVPSTAHDLVDPIVRHSRESVATYARILDWMLSDIARAEQDAFAISNFSKQLVDSYEQMSMLYHVADSMNGLKDPHGFVCMACDLLRNTLEFDWIAVRFTSLPSLGRVLTNDLVIAGEISCSHTRYDRLAGELASASTAEDRPQVIDRQTSRLAELVDSEVFVNPLICDNNLAGILLAGNKTGIDPDISTVDMQLISATADYVSAFLHNSALYNEQRTMFLGIIKALSASIDAKDRYTRGHSERVAHLASELALAIGMTDEQAERVRLAGILHDMGKIGVPESVLLKPGRLTDEEFNAIKRHPTIGFNILKDIEPLEDVLPGVLYHHERWDGRGYPHGLRGGDIPLIGRLLAVADAFDAMSSDRAYRPRISRQKVLMEMRDGAGTQWDRELIKVFLTLDLSKYDGMIDRHAAQDQQAAA